MTTQSHHDHVEKQFSSQACEYLTSTVHASDEIYSAWRCVWLIILVQVYLIWAAEQGMPALSLRKT
ncbi:ubiquinone biosynthesis methyltransferase UbiE [Escherichia coli]|nr:ubiquinone biosynthesis methyltransferase UbiE [Escherichia coli]EHI0871749.1 ubiquinone biosynthesis methyltransferase UbiE [Escherichia coli]